MDKKTKITILKSKKTQKLKAASQSVMVKKTKGPVAVSQPIIKINIGDKARAKPVRTGKKKPSDDQQQPGGPGLEPSAQQVRFLSAVPYSTPSLGVSDILSIVRAAQPAPASRLFEPAQQVTMQPPPQAAIQVEKPPVEPAPQSPAPPSERRRPGRPTLEESMLRGMISRQEEFLSRQEDLMRRESDRRQDIEDLREQVRKSKVTLPQVPEESKQPSPVVRVEPPTPRVEPAPAGPSAEPAISMTPIPPQSPRLPQTPPLRPMASSFMRPTIKQGLVASQEALSPVSVFDLESGSEAESVASTSNRPVVSLSAEERRAERRVLEAEALKLDDRIASYKYKPTTKKSTIEKNKARRVEVRESLKELTELEEKIARKPQQTLPVIAPVMVPRQASFTQPSQPSIPGQPSTPVRPSIRRMGSSIGPTGIEPAPQIVGDVTLDVSKTIQEMELRLVEISKQLASKQVSDVMKSALLIEQSRLNNDKRRLETVL